MTRRPKPTAQHIAEGTYRKHRHANRGDAVTAPGFPVMPDGLTPAQTRLWDQVTQNLPPGSLGSVDEAGLNELCSVYQMMLEAKAQTDADVCDKDARIAYTAYFDRFMRLYTEYGGTPAARTKMQLPKNPADDEVDPFEEYLKMRNESR